MSFAETVVHRRRSGEVPELLHCSICMDGYNSLDRQPKLLPCHHSFCKSCLLSLVTSQGQILCPTCRERATVSSPPPYGVSRLQTNFYITQMKDYLEQDVKTKGCRKHDNGVLGLFCVTCEVLICGLCRLGDHKDTSGHEVQDVDTAKCQQIGLLHTEIASSKQMIMEYTMKIRNYETELINLSTAKGRAIQNVDNAFDKYIEVLNKRRKQLKEDIHAEFSTRRGALQQDMDAHKVITASLNGLIEQVKESVENGNISDLLAYRAKLAAKNQEIGHDAQLIQRDMGENFIRFESDESEVDFLDMIQRLGSVKVKESLPCKVKVTKSHAIASLFTNFTVVVFDAKGTELGNYPISVEITDVHDDLIPSLVQYRSKGQYEVTFRPEVSGLHRVQVKFLDQVIRGGTFALEVLSNDPVGIIGGQKNEEADMEYPRSVAVDQQNSLFVVDTGNNRIQKFNKSGNYLSELTISNESEIYSSCGMAVDEVQGRLICPEVCVQEADLSEASAILIYSMEGELLERYVYRDIMRRALSVAVDSASHMIIADYELHTVFVFDKNGRLLHKFGENGCGPGQFNNPTFLCIGQNNTIIVSDGNNHRIQVFDRMGKFMYQFGERGSGKGQFNMPFGVAADYHGNMLVVDGGNKRVQVFKQGSGEFLACIESLGDPLSAPRGIAVTSDGYALIADRDNHCVKKYKYLHCTSL